MYVCMYTHCAGSVTAPVEGGVSRIPPTANCSGGWTEKKKQGETEGEKVHCIIYS